MKGMWIVFLLGTELVDWIRREENSRASDTSFQHIETVVRVMETVSERSWTNKEVAKLDYSVRNIQEPVRNLFGMHQHSYICTEKLHEMRPLVENIRWYWNMKMLAVALYKEQNVSYEEKYRWTSRRCATCIVEGPQLAENRSIIGSRTVGYSNSAKNHAPRLKTKTIETWWILAMEIQCFYDIPTDFCRLQNMKWDVTERNLRGHCLTNAKRISANKPLTFSVKQGTRQDIHCFCYCGKKIGIICSTTVFIKLVANLQLYLVDILNLLKSALSLIKDPIHYVIQAYKETSLGV